jgi:hypothetical protein
MSSERLRTQTQFEHILSGNDPAVWGSLTKGQIKAFQFNVANNAILESALIDDAIDFYYKGILSLYEALISSYEKSFSWATVKVYYSVFYFLRSSLCCKKVGFVRKSRDAYYFQNNLLESPKKLSSPDHKAAIELFVLFYGKSDFLQSNSINGTNPYEWLMKQRENVNYRYRTFYEPDVPSIWEVVAGNIESEGLEYWIKKYLDENIYAFLEDHAVVALPIKRLFLTHADMLNQNIRVLVKPEKQTKLLELSSKHSYLKILKPFNSGKL